MSVGERPQINCPAVKRASLRVASVSRIDFAGNLGNRGFKEVRLHICQSVNQMIRGAATIGDQTG